MAVVGPAVVPSASQRGLGLRPWQVDAAAAAREWWQAAEPAPALISAVMGAGKTHLTGALCRSWYDTLGVRECVVILVPTTDLVLQTSSELRGEWIPAGKVGVWYGREKEPAPVTVATYASATKLAGALGELRWSTRFMVADEAHRSENPRGHSALDAFGSCPVLGLSATPYRSSVKGSLQKFEAQLYRYGPEDAVRDGFLVYFDTHSADRDFTSDETDDVCEAMAREAMALGPMVCNAETIDDAEAFASRLAAAGVPSMALHSKTPGSIHARGTESWRIIRKLEEGKIACVVYPTLLSEGINLPWLVSLIMRRKISSRVRFAQESGRVLRAAPGKTRAHLWDPHDLTNALSISYDAALGWIEPDPAEVLHDAIERRDREHLRDLGEEFATMPPATKLPLAAAFLRRLANAWRQAGGLRKMQSARWRRMEPARGHLRALERNRAWVLERARSTPEHRLLAECLSMASELDRGTVVDLLELCQNGIARQRDVWPKGWGDGLV